MRYMIALDFETTAMPTYEQTCSGDWFAEIIEIGAVVFDVNSFQFLGEFQRYVRPTRFPILSAECQRKFGISQDMVDRAIPLQRVLPELNQWLSQFNAEYVCTWSDADLKTILPREAREKNIRYNHFLQRYINIQKEVQLNYLRSPLGLFEAAHYPGAETYGTAHSALSDAKTLASITHLLRRKNIRNFSTFTV